jgi:hypothetical protein
MMGWDGIESNFKPTRLMPGPVVSKHEISEAEEDNFTRVTDRLTDTLAEQLKPLMIGPSFQTNGK